MRDGGISQGGGKGRFVALGLSFVLLLSTLTTVIAPAYSQTAYSVELSYSPDRSNPVALEGEAVAGTIYVYVDPEDDIKKVRFWLDDPSKSGGPIQTESKAPYDFAGTEKNRDAKPSDTNNMGDGPHTISVEIEFNDGSTQDLTSSFTVQNNLRLEFDQPAVNFSVPLDGSDNATLGLSTSDGGSTSYSVIDDAEWLTAAPTTGSTPASITLTVDATGLGPGSYSANVSVTDTSGAYATNTLPVQLTVGASYGLLVSTNPDRSSPVPLDGETVVGSIYVFTSPDTGVDSVEFFLDDPGMAGSPYQRERRAPFDFAGSAGGSAKPFDSSSVADGPHTITAAVATDGGSTEVVSATFDVGSSFHFDPSSVSFIVAAGGSDSATVTLDTSDGGAASFTVSDDAPWLTISPATGQAGDTLTLNVDSSGLDPGAYTATVTATDTGGFYADATLSVQLTMDFGLSLSLLPDRSGAVPLSGQLVEGDVFVFVTPETSISKVDFYLDDPTKSGSPIKTEVLAPYDFAGTAADGSALPFDSASLSIGTHTITATVFLTSGGTRTANGDFEVPHGLVSVPGTVLFSLEAGASDSAQVSLDTDDGTVAAFTTSSDAPWLSVVPASGSTPDALTVSVDSAGLSDGSFTGTVAASSAGYRTSVIPVQLDVGNPLCAPLACEDVLVSLPYLLDFSVDRGELVDGAGVGTGFTWIDRPSNGTGYLPANLQVDTGAEELRVTTTAGIAFTNINSLDNALGVGLDAPSQISIISTTIVDPPAGTGQFQQAGLWFGNDEDNRVKLVVVSTPGGLKIQYLMEVGGAVADSAITAALSLTGRDVELVLRVDPSDRSIQASYGVDGAAPAPLDTFTAPAEFFSFDAAGNDPRIGTRTFTGIQALHRNGPAPLVYTFDAFAITVGSVVNLGSGFQFERTSFPVPFPTAMAWGPDGNLYVAELFGTVHRITLDANNQVIQDDVIDTVTDDFGGGRLALGLTIDPASTASNVVVWVNHSSGSVNAGEANSGVVSRLSGPSLGTIDNVVTGVPRAIANHGPNAIHFRSDGRLYIAVGGNTGAGAPNTEATEFGTRPEQPLSAALLVADVNAAGFSGDCASAVDDSTGTASKVIPASCDVELYATGLRNTFDFVFHSNGQTYAPDNGLGVKGTFPQSATPDCQGIVSYTSAFDPGEQPDPLNRIVEGQYYGHPNPARDECVFKDGTLQGALPLPNYQGPFTNLGVHKSANGIIEYTDSRRCGDLVGDLLIANFSVGDDLTRIRLTPDGLGMDAIESLVGGFDDPLPIAMRDDGTIFVGEFGAGVITALTPTDIGCWATAASAPAQLLDAGGAAAGGLMYVVGGKTPVGPHSTVYVYDPGSDSWSTVADLPGAAVENPAVVALDGKVYAFGGSTSPFSGAVNNAAVFDPGSGNWSTLAGMPTARGGATAQAIGGLIYVAGGIDGSGASVDVLEIYDPSTNTWSAGAPMAIRRDNPGSAVLGGDLYVFGGRIRDASGTEVNPTLNSVEMYDPSTNTWTPRTAMPTGRRTMVVGTLNGKAQVMGGEKTPTGGAFAANEQYDAATDTWSALYPMLTPRHGAAAATIGTTIYTVGGGAVGGGSFSDLNETYAFEN